MTSAASPPPSTRLDWQRIEHWATAIAADDPSDVRRVFGGKGARGPDIVWRPPPERAAVPQLRFALRYWADLAASRPMPRASEIDAVEMRPALGYVNLLDAVDDGRDFHYRLFGSTVAAVSGFDLTGRLASTMKASAYIVEFTLAVFRATLRRCEPLLTEHGPPATVYTLAWHRLVLPLADDQGKPVRLITVAVPVARDGRPVTLRL